LKSCFHPVLLFILLSTTLGAQQPLYYQFTHIGENEGLSSTNARKILQDPYGFTWVGTQDGLNRFDGKNTVVYNKDKKNHHKLSGSDIRDLLIDSTRKMLWVLTSYGGLDGIDYTTGTVNFTIDQPKDTYLAATLLNSLALVNAQLFIGSSNGLLTVNARTRKLEPFMLSPQVNTPVNIDRILVLSESKMCLFTQNIGIQLIDIQQAKILKEYKNSVHARDLRTYDCLLLNINQVLFASNYGLLQLNLTSSNEISIDTTFLSDFGLANHNPVYSCWKDRSDFIWFSDAQTVLRLDPFNKTYNVLKENSSFDDTMWLPAVYSIYTDKKDVLWLGCQKGLAFADNRPSPFFRISKSPTSLNKIEHAYYTEQINDSSLLICSPKGLFTYNPLSSDIRVISQELAFYYSFSLNKNRIIASNTEGTFIIENNQMVPWERIYREFKSLPRLILNSRVNMGDSVLLFGTENFHGLVVWNYIRKTARLINTETPVRLKEKSINALFKDKSNEIWVLGDHSISILDPSLSKCREVFPYNPANRTYYSIFFDVCQVNDQYFIASYSSGIIVLDKNLNFVREITTKDGLTNNGVYKLLPYRDSIIFVTSNNGLSVLKTTKTAKPLGFFRNDGLHANTFEENSGCIYKDMIIAGGSGGLTIIKPELFMLDTIAPPLYLDKIVSKRKNGILDTSNITMSEITIPNDVIQTDIFFSALNYTDIHSTRYTYQIPELHDQWIPLDDKFFISLIGVAPGRYQLLVKASNENALWTTEPYTLQLIFQPKWYQSNSFKLIVLLLTLLLLYGLYRYRLIQLRKQESIRKEIASDLHDDIGSSLNSMKIFTHMAIKGPNSKEYLGYIEESITHTTQGLRDIIWVLDDSFDTVQELMERIKAFANPICLPLNVTIKCIVNPTGRNMKLEKAEKRNFLLIAKEVINNSIKYAGCSEIHVAIDFTKTDRIIEIGDNGRGFDMQKSRTGNGIKNIQERARQMGYNCTLNSSVTGTIIKLHKKLM
jgi:signal transduction histidine kinase/ligand-binding sensor domain-containing protein